MNTNRQRMIGTAIGLAIAISATGSSLADTKKTYSFGIVPQQAASKLARLWTPILKHVSAKSGYTLSFRTAKNIPAFEKQLAAGNYDFSYMNPYHYTVFSQNPGYRAFGRQADKRIRGIMVVRKDNPINSLKDLSGSTIAFPAPAAFAASVLQRAKLSNDKIPFSAKYVSSHDSVYRSVAKGLFPAGGGIQRTLGNVAPEIRAQLKILWTTDGFTPHAFAVHPNVAKDVGDKIAAAFIDLSASAEGKALLKAINFKAIQSAANEDWDDVRALGIDLLTNLIKSPGK